MSSIVLALALVLAVFIMLLPSPSVGASRTTNPPFTSVSAIGNNAGGFPDHELSGEDHFGQAVGRVGDINGDGIADFVVGAPFDNHRTGAVYILQMTAQQTTVERAFKITKHGRDFAGDLSAGDAFGYSVDGIGDVDGDGVPDIAAGANSDNHGGQDAGAVYVMLMKADAKVKTTVKITTGQGNFPFPLRDYDHFGTGLAGVGDINNDGVCDIAVGAMKDCTGAADAGAVYVLRLQATGAVLSAIKIANAMGGLSVSLADGANFGFQIAAIGDVNDDNVPDIAVGAPNAEHGGKAGAGSVHVLHLTHTGTVCHDFEITPGSSWWFREGEHFGAPARIGDVDGDGVDDLAVGAWGTNSVYVLLMQANGLVRKYRKITGIDSGSFGKAISFVERGAGVSLLVGAPSSGSGKVFVVGLADRTPSPTPSRSWSATRSRTPSHSATHSRSRSPSATRSRTPSPSATRSRTPSSSATSSRTPSHSATRSRSLSPSLSPSATIAPFVAGSVMPIMNGASGFPLCELAHGDAFGTAVAGVGDLNADGVNDMVVGAPGSDNAKGCVHFLLMATQRPMSPVLDTTRICAASPRGFEGSLAPGDRFGSAVAGMGEMDANGGPDVAIGAAGNSDGAGAVYFVWLQRKVVRAIRTFKLDGSVFSGLGLAVPKAGDGFGSAVSFVGDLDDNGASDVVVGAPGDDDSVENAGAVYVAMIQNNHTHPVLKLIKLADGQGGLEVLLHPNDAFGFAVADVGDRDGDGVGDIGVGAAGDSHWAANGGATHVVLLRPDGRAKSSFRELGQLGHGSHDGQGFGVVAKVGDVDGDGVADLLVGSQRGGWNVGPPQPAGSGEGFEVVVVGLMDSDGGVKKSGGLRGTALEEQVGSGSGFGWSLGWLQDGTKESEGAVVVGAPWAVDERGKMTGAVFLVRMPQRPPRNHKDDGGSSHTTTIVLGVVGGVAFGLALCCLGAVRRLRRSALAYDVQRDEPPFNPAWSPRS